MLIEARVQYQDREVKYGRLRKAYQEDELVGHVPDGPGFGLRFKGSRFRVLVFGFRLSGFWSRVEG